MWLVFEKCLYYVFSRMGKFFLEALPLNGDAKFLLISAIVAKLYIVVDIV